MGQLGSTSIRRAPLRSGRNGGLDLYGLVGSIPTRSRHNDDFAVSLP